MTKYIFSAAVSTSGVTINTVDITSNGYGLASSLLSVIDSNGLANTPQYITVSVPTTADYSLLTSVGRVSPGDFGITGTAWRMRNGTGGDLQLQLQGAGYGYINPAGKSYNLFAGTDTYVISPFTTGSATHILSPEQRGYRKAASDLTFTEVVNDQEASLTNADNYVLFGGSYNDSLIGNGSSDTLSGGDGNDTLSGLGGEDLLDGGNGNDRLDGAVGDDTLLGGVGNDSLLGGLGNDSLLGGDGQDTLLGNANDDILVGGAGNDTLTGGTGSDQFVFNQTASFDTVTDFNKSQGDVFLLDSSVYAGVSAGALTVITPPPIPGGGAADNIIVGTTAQISGFNSASDVRFAYNTTTNRLFYDADGNFSGGSILIANVNSTTFANGDNTSFAVI